jgi:hypothetical protein
MRVLDLQPSSTTLRSTMSRRYNSIARVLLSSVMTAIYFDISLDGQEHYHNSHLELHNREAPFGPLHAL